MKKIFSLLILLACSAFLVTCSDWLEDRDNHCDCYRYIEVTDIQWAHTDEAELGVWVGFRNLSVDPVERTRSCDAHLTNYRVSFHRYDGSADVPAPCAQDYELFLPSGTDISSLFSICAPADVFWQPPEGYDPESEEPFAKGWLTLEFSGNLSDGCEFHIVAAFHVIFTD